MKKKVLLADDHEVVTDGLEKILADIDDFQVVAVARNGKETIQKVEELKPDIAIIDIGMPGISGVAATRQIKDKFPEIKVVILSVYSRRQIVLDALKAGASGYILKCEASQDILSALKAIARGEQFISPSIMGLLIDLATHPEQRKQTDIKELLTSREIEIIKLISEGHSSSEIADKLYVAKRTVEAHRANIMRKLKIHSIAELIKIAIAEGIIPLEK